MDRSTKKSNGAIVQVSLDFLKKFGYQKVHFVIVQVMFEDFTQSSYVLVFFGGIRHELTGFSAHPGVPSKFIRCWSSLVASGCVVSSVKLHAYNLYGFSLHLSRRLVLRTDLQFSLWYMLQLCDVFANS